MNIIQAKKTEANQFNQVLVDAATRIQGKGSSQWQHVLVGEEQTQIETRIAAKEAFFYKEGEQIVGAFYLYEAPTDWDVMLWGEEEQSNVYYLHKLSLADGYTGKGLAHSLLESLQQVYENEEEPVEIRLDCMAEKGVLKNLYSTSGFHFLQTVKDVPVDDLQADFNLYNWKNKKATRLSL